MSYRIIGAEMSPYSVKVRSCFRYKSIDHQWISHNIKNQGEFQKYARLPLIPIVITPDDEGVQDSTPILELLEERFPEPSIHPQDPVLRFLSELLEEYADEWGNKLMFHQRWWNEVDQLATARTLSRIMLPDATEASQDELAASIHKRMSSRGQFVGSSAATAPLIDRYFRDLLNMLETHLTERPYLFGCRPAFADFGLAAQVYEMALDPGPGGVIRGSYQRTLDWCYRMLDPKSEGAFETWESLAPTLGPLLKDVGERFLPWSCANAKALTAGEDEFSVRLGGDDQAYTQAPQKYHAKSLQKLREKYARTDNSKLDSILEEHGCRQGLAEQTSP